MPVTEAALRCDKLRKPHNEVRALQQRMFLASSSHFKVVSSVKSYVTYRTQSAELVQPAILISYSTYSRSGTIRGCEPRPPAPDCKRVCKMVAKRDKLLTCRK